MPHYNWDPERDHNFDNHPYVPWRFLPTLALVRNDSPKATMEEGGWKLSMRNPCDLDTPYAATVFWQSETHSSSVGRCIAVLAC